MSSVTRQDITKATEAIHKIVASVQKAKDPEKAKTLAEKIERAAAKLQRLTLAYEAQEREKLKVPILPQESRVRVKLTQEQRNMVLGETGLSLEEVELKGSQTILLQSIRRATPPNLDAAVLKAAKRVKAKREAQAQAKRVLDRLEAIEDPKLKEQVERARRDPDFLGGLLQKAKGD